MVKYFLDSSSSRSCKCAQAHLQLLLDKSSLENAYPLDKAENRSCSFDKGYDSKRDTLFAVILKSHKSYCTIFVHLIRMLPNQQIV